MKEISINYNGDTYIVKSKYDYDLYEAKLNRDKEIEKLKNRIHALEKHNQRLQLEAQKYFDLLMECEYGDKGEDK